MTLPDFLTQNSEGEIVLTGHRIGLFTLVRAFQRGEPVEQIRETYPSLPPALIEATQAFYRANQVEADRYVADYQAETERQIAALPSGPDRAELLRRWQARGLGPWPCS